MSPNRPYLLRALYEWISDNAMTPHILVDADHPGVEVPEQAVQKGKVILNIDQAAVHQLELGNELVNFNARFSGQRHSVQVPVDAVLAIYSKENGQGMMFAQDDENDPPGGPDDGDKPKMKRPHLRVVK
ncbi:MAG TPA: ClpXP protease specificity-enhancing factor [Xanthomonadales bacterium]|nr:ClpXP protease specificity-enhancing factor [Xanthomonadales bacterium]